MTKLQLKNKDGVFYIVDNDDNIVITDIHNADIYERKQVEGYIIRFFTKDNRFSFINERGLFFDKYSCEEYDMVNDIIPNTIDILVTIKNKKCGLILNWDQPDEVLEPVYDKIESLRSNRYNEQDLLKLTKNGKVRLIHGYAPLKESEVFDYIYTPTQPLERFIVKKSEKYGFIDAESLNVIIPITYDSIEELCTDYNYNVRKYTEDLYNCENKIAFECFVDHLANMSFYRDKTGIVNGRWEDYSENFSIIDCRTDDVLVHMPYYSPISNYIPINEYGYFYNLFDARNFDVVVHQIDNIYLVSKDNKYGLMDDEFHWLLDIKYKNIQIVHFQQAKNLPLFVVTCEEGQFIYDAKDDTQTRLYESISWHDEHYLSGYYNNFFMYKDRGRSGLLSPTGEILVKAKYKEYNIPSYKRNCIIRGQAYFCDVFKGIEMGFYIDDKKFFGKIPVEDYDTCFEMGESWYHYYITKRHGKYELINHKLETIKIPLATT